jgi:RNA polymerase sigma-70 factor (ECF subfamily)
VTANVTALDKRRTFDELIAHYRDDLYRYAFWLSRNPDVAEDVVQEAMLRAWKKFPDLRDASQAKPWLLTIVRRENARHFERQRAGAVDLDHVAGELAVSGDDPDIAVLREGILRLEPDYREPLVLQVLMGFSTQEIAAMLDLTQGAVLTRLHRARGQLKALLGDDPGERGKP